MARQRQTVAQGRIRIESEEQAQAHSARAAGRDVSRARASRQRDVRRQPFLPYTTSTLQQDASVRLRFKPKRR